MRYLLALLCPPLAVLLCGRPFLSVLNFALTACLYFPGALHSMLVVSKTHADRRHKEQLAANGRDYTILGVDVDGPVQNVIVRKGRENHPMEEWTSVDDKGFLPMKPYLVSVPYCNHPYVTIGLFDDQISGEWSNEEGELIKPSHWRELPKPFQKTSEE